MPPQNVPVPQKEFHGARASALFFALKTPRCKPMIGEWTLLVKQEL